MSINFIQSFFYFIFMKFFFVLRVHGYYYSAEYCLSSWKTKHVNVLLYWGTISIICFFNLAFNLYENLTSEYKRKPFLPILRFPKSFEKQIWVNGNMIITFVSIGIGHNKCLKVYSVIIIQHTFQLKLC